MNHSAIQGIIYKLIADPDTNIKLENFYDEGFIQSIITKYPKYEEFLSDINVIDIVKVASRLMKEQDLPAKEIWYLVSYISSNYNPQLMNDSEFVIAYSRISQKIKIEISALDSQIKRSKNQATKIRNEKLINRNQVLATAVAVNEEIINDSISRLKECTKFTIKFNSGKNISKRYKLQKKQLKKSDNYINEPSEKSIIFGELRKLSSMIDNKKTEDTDILGEVIRITEKYNLNKSCYRNDINNIIKKLNERSESDSNKYSEIKKNIDDLESEYSNYVYLTDEEIDELKMRKKILIDANELLDSLEDEIELTSDEYKRKIGFQVKASKVKAKRDSENHIQEYEENNEYFKEGDKPINKNVAFFDKDMHANKINIDITSMLYNYQPINEYAVKEAFCLDNKEYDLAGNEKIFIHKYAFSIDFDSNNTIVRIHVINEFPYVSRDAKNFIIDYYSKTELIKERTARGELKLEHELDDNTYYIQKVISNNVSFKKDKVYPTIAYTFTFDQNYHLTNFNIEKADVVLHDNNIDQLTVLNNICDMNNADGKYHNTKEFFEKILQKQFINYAVNNKLPVIYYGKYIDDSHGNIKEGQKLGQQVLLPYDQERIADTLGDCEDRVLDNAHFRWFKNYRMKHFSLNYHDDSKYYIKDLGLINPESFMGYNVQRVINKCVFSNITAGIPVYDELVASQWEYVNKLNKAIEFIDIDTFVNSLASIENEQKRKGSK